MKKGKFGIGLPAFAVLAFLLAVFNQTLAGLVLLGFVILEEKDEWLTKQCMQALILGLMEPFVSAVLNGFNIFRSVPVLKVIPGTVNGFIEKIVTIICLIWAFIALSKVKKGEDAGVPIAHKFADWAYGFVNAYAPAKPVQGTPVQQNMPQGSASAPQDNAVVRCPKCGTVVPNGADFCPNCGTKVK
jgi:uncharacterized membrane protein